MVELATLQAVSYIMGSLGVFVAAVYYVLNVQNNSFIGVVNLFRNYYFF